MQLVLLQATLLPTVSTDCSHMHATCALRFVP